MLEPNRVNYAPFNDGTRWSLPDKNKYAHIHPELFLAASNSKDPVLQRFVRMLYGDLKITDRFHDYSGYIPMSVLLYERNSDVPVDEWSINSSRVWPEAGKVVLRSSVYDDSKAQFVAMECGLHGSHSHKDQSTFIYTAHGQNFIDDNNYGSIESSFQNVILVDGNGQASGTRDEALGYTNNFLDGSEVSFVSADSTYAYQANSIGINSMQRNIMLRKEMPDQPGYTVIFDKVRASSPHTYTWRAASQTGVFDLSTTSYGFLFDAKEDLAKNIPDANLNIHIASPAIHNKYLEDGHVVINSSGTSSNEDFAVLLFPSTP